MGNSELAERGILVLRNRVRGSDRSCWVHNTSRVPVELKRKVVIAQVREPVQRTAAVWTVYALDSEDEQEMKDQPQNLEETEAEVQGCHSGWNSWKSWKSWEMGYSKKNGWKSWKRVPIS